MWGYPFSKYTWLFLVIIFNFKVFLSPEAKFLFWQPSNTTDAIIKILFILIYLSRLMSAHIWNRTQHFAMGFYYCSRIINPRHLVFLLSTFIIIWKYFQNFIINIKTSIMRVIMIKLQLLIIYNSNLFIKIIFVKSVYYCKITLTA